MPLEFVNASGQPWAPSEIRPKIRPKKEAPEEWHKGFDVVGRDPGACAAAKALRDQECIEWDVMPEDARAKLLKEGKRKPSPWDEAKWRIAAPKKRLRAKPFSIPQAAQEMAELCRRAGFEDVEVTELAKRKA